MSAAGPSNTMGIEASIDPVPEIRTHRRRCVVLRYAKCIALALSAASLEVHAQDNLENRPLAPPASFHVDSLVPTDDELQAKAARVGSIEIRINDIFDSIEPLSAPYRLANGLHISTRPGVIRAQLLFGPGEPFSRQALDETARALRAQRYLREASVEPVRYDEATNTVDVLVRVNDVWTLSPGFSFGRKGGKNSSKLKFEDENFLGLGKAIEMSRTDDADRGGWHFSYSDPNVLGSRWKMSAAYGSLSDGSEKLLEVGRPFYSMNARSAFEVRMADATMTRSRYALGEVVSQFAMREKSVEVSGGLSSGLHDGWVRRVLAGIHYQTRDFSTLVDRERTPLPEDRVLAYPWIGLEWIEDEYAKSWNLDQIGRTEDLYLGKSARLEAGFASTAFGSSHDALILKGRLQTAAELTGERYVFGTLEYTGRLVEQGSIRDGRLDVGARYYVRQSPRRVLFAAATGSLTEKLDESEQLLLGGDNGLRGYPLRYQGGTASALFTLEERFYTNWQLLKLVNVGAAAFFDVGRTWGRDPFAGASSGWLKDVGVGLRLGNARSALGNVLHIDLAFPLDGRDIDSVQLIVETRRSF